MTVPRTAPVGHTGPRVPARRTLRRRADPVLARIRSHPFWRGLRDGTLPPAELARFAAQDATFLVPAYARALARGAAAAPGDGHGELLSSAAAATFGSLPRLRAELPGVGAGPVAGPADPVVRAYASFLLAAPVTASFPGMVGALLPMSWFHLEVSRELAGPAAGGTRYARWVAQFRAHDGFADYLEALLTMADAVAAGATGAQRREFFELFSTAADFELLLADYACSPLPQHH